MTPRTPGLWVVVIWFLVSTSGFGGDPDFHFQHRASGGSAEATGAAFGMLLGLAFQSLSLVSGVVLILTNTWTFAKLWKGILALTVVIYVATLALEPTSTGFLEMFEETRRFDTFTGLVTLLLSAGIVILVLGLVSWATVHVRRMIQQRFTPTQTEGQTAEHPKD